MKDPKLSFAVLSLLILAPIAYAGKEVDRLLAEYSKIESVTCQISVKFAELK